MTEQQWPPRRALGGPEVALPARNQDVLVEVAALLRRRLRHVRAAPGRLLAVVMNPLVTLLAVGYLFADAIVVPGAGDHYIDYLLAGVAAQAVLGTIGPTGVSLRLDVDKGLMDRFRSLPITRSSVLVAHSLADLLIGAAALVSVTVVGFLLGWRPHASAASVAIGFAVLLLFCYVMVWLGIALGLAMRSAESIDAVSALIVVIFTFVSNAILSPTSLPQWIRPFAEWNPLSAVATLARQLWGNPTGPLTSWPSQFPGIVFALTGGLGLVVCVVYARRRYRIVR